MTKTYIQTVNGVKLTVTESDGVTYYKTQDEMVQFKQYKNADNHIVMSGAAYGREAERTARQLFPKMEIETYRGAADDDTPDNFPCYEFYRVEKF